MKISYENYYHIPWKQLDGIYDIENVGTYYWKNGCRHRNDGPAIVYLNGDKYWIVNNNLHRLNGPAVELNNGDVEYYINGKEFYTKKEFELAAYLHLNNLQDYL